MTACLALSPLERRHQNSHSAFAQKHNHHDKQPPPATMNIKRSLVIVVSAVVSTPAFSEEYADTCSNRTICADVRSDVVQGFTTACLVNDLGFGSLAPCCATKCLSASCMSEPVCKEMNWDAFVSKQTRFCSEMYGLEEGLKQCCADTCKPPAPPQSGDSPE